MRFRVEPTQISASFSLINEATSVKRRVFEVDELAGTFSGERTSHCASISATWSKSDAAEYGGPRAPPSLCDRQKVVRVLYGANCINGDVQRAVCAILESHGKRKA